MSFQNIKEMDKIIISYLIQLTPYHSERILLVKSEINNTFHKSYNKILTE